MAGSHPPITGWFSAPTDTIGKWVSRGEQNCSFIAREVGCSPYLVKNEVKRLGRYVTHAERMAARPPKPPKLQKVLPSDYVAAVVKLRDVDHLTFEGIARQLKISPRMVQKAYDLGRPDIIAAAAASGAPPRRSHNARMSKSTIARIKDLIERKCATTEIMKQTGASRNMINVYRRHFLDQVLAKAVPGTTAAEIAAKTGCRLRSVKRRM